MVLRRLYLRAALIAALLAGSHGLLSQDPASPDDGSQHPPTQAQTSTESTSKPDDAQVPEANPARPTISNPATIPPVGYIQLEQGFLQAGSSPSGLSRQFSVVQTTRLSLHPRLMVDFASQPFAVSRTAVSPGSPETAQVDTGDLDLGVQGIFIKEKGPRPTVAVGYQYRVRSGSAPDLDIGGFTQSAVVLVSGDLGGFHYDSNFVVSEQADGGIRRAQYGQALSVSHALFGEKLQGKLGISGEIWHFTQPLVDTTRTGASSERSNAVGTLWALGYTVRPNLVLDGGFDRGLTASSTAWEGFAGFTYLIPHRLWGGRNARR
jgi:hypothetical protein